MRTEDILDAIGNVDDAYVAKAREPKKADAVRLVLGSIGSVAAGLIVMFLLLNIMNFIGYSSSGGPSYGDGQSPQIENIKIYYVENGKLESEYVRLYPYDAGVIEAWKEKNKIPGDVYIQKSIISENGHVTMFLLISEDFMKCCDVDIDLYLESLKKTMAYSVDKVDEYYITFD